MTAINVPNWRSLAAAAIPWGADVAPARRWLWHVAIWAGVIVGLGCVNRVAGLERLMNSPWPTLHRYWLPLVGIAVYALIWLGYGLWISLRAGAANAIDSSINLAWRAACEQLERAGVNQADLPFFLFLGPRTGEIQGLLDSSGAKAVAAGGMEVFVHPQAIVIACDNSSCLASLCPLLLEARAARPPIQGMVIAVPATCTASERALKTMIEACHGDLGIVRRATGLETPIYLALAGFDAPVQDCFQRFPPLADLGSAELAAMYRDGIDEWCLEQLPRQLRSLCRLPAAPLDFAEVARLQRWQTAATKLRRVLQRLILEGTRNASAKPGMVAGCYVLANPTVESRKPHPLWSDLLDHQGYAISVTSAVAA